MITETPRNKASKKTGIVAVILITALLMLIVWTAWGNTALTVNRMTVSSPRLPSGFDGFRIAQVSDLHNAAFGKNNKTLLDTLSDCDPDIIVITGDLVDSGHPDVEIALDFAKNSVQIAPTYYVTGNHESGISGYEVLRYFLEKLGVVVLEDAAVLLSHRGAEVTLLGLSDPAFSGESDLFSKVPAMVETKLRRLTEEVDGYTILLSHRPELFGTYVTCNMDLVLSGHAHGGQFRLPFIGGLVAPNQGLFPKYDAGLYADGNTQMIVSRGLGNSILPFRFNNRPEIVLVELSSEPYVHAAVPQRKANSDR